MLDYTGNTNQNPNERPRLVQIVKELIHTKVSYLEFQQEFLYSSFEEMNSIDQLKANNEHRLQAVKAKFDELINETEQLAYARDLLILVKSFLKEETAQAIYELINNDKYLFYTPNSIKRLLGLESHMQAYLSNVARN